MRHRTTRRQLLKGAGAAGLGWAGSGLLDAAHAAWAGPQAAPARQPKNVREPAAVELAVATICCDGFGDEDFRYSFDAVSQLGFTNVEFNVWYPRNLTPAGVESIRARCAARGLEPVCLQGSAFAGGNKDALLKDVTHKLWLMQCCRALGCRRVKCTAAARGAAGGLGDVITVVRELAPAAEEMGMLLLLENHFRNNLELPDDYDAVFAKVDSPNVGMCLDPGHFAASGVDISQLIGRFHDRILHVDLKDLQRPGETKWAKFGRGVVDLPGMVDSVLARGYQGYLVVELSLQDRATMMDDLRAGYEMFKKYETRKDP